MFPSRRLFLRARPQYHHLAQDRFSLEYRIPSAWLTNRWQRASLKWWKGKWLIRIGFRLELTCGTRAFAPISELFEMSIRFWTKGYKLGNYRHNHFYDSMMEWTTNFMNDIAAV